jgi:hypothetical protein
MQNVPFKVERGQHVAAGAGSESVTTQNNRRMLVDGFRLTQDFCIMKCFWRDYECRPVHKALKIS